MNNPFIFNKMPTQLRLLFIYFFLLISALPGIAQPALENKYPDYAFQNYQMSFDRVKAAFSKSEFNVRKMFEDKKIKYPCKNILFRAIKASNEFELWGRNQMDDTFVLIKHYKICALSGILGPKRWEGDKQVPEGFYFISDFKPNSAYHLSMLLNYPNYSDMMKGNKEHPGGDIYIHGACMTVGCVPMTDEWIEELYVISMIARINGQLNIPVHVYPLRYTQKGLDYIGKEYKDESEKQEFWVNLKRAYDYFEATHKTLPVMYDEKGNYAF
ncbi:MAG TPA: L,D-transpeptidase family protein [Chitinophagaceae bacterium]|jgi:murein L,D-transpeptidase YafK|nr:L,D-transpeptidase family protein [Chitinophagaceae bacterium]